jgi:hypothetical protein
MLGGADVSKTDGENEKHYILMSENKLQKVEGLEYWRRWNLKDVSGTYHVSRIKSKFPIPGTAVIEDIEHIQKKAADVKRFEDGIFREASKTRNRIKLRKDTAAFNTRIDFEANVLGQINASEEVMNQTYVLLRPPPALSDTPKEIKRFFSNVERGNANYVAYAIAAGFASINWQEPEFGNTCLHQAVKRGDVEMVETLLRYKADPEIKNRLGYYPIHFSWGFWKRFKMAEENLPQENLTVQMLSVLCSFSTVPDKQQELDGSTPLHLAAKFGPTRAAITLMGFKAKHNITNANGETPFDIAVRKDRKEISQLIRMWDMIHHQMVHCDFMVLWSKFIADYESVISNTKPAQKILFELQMMDGIKTLEREVKHDFLLDDDLMRQTLKDDALNEREKVLKPWEEGYKDWKEFRQNELEREAIAKREMEDAILKSILGKSGDEKSSSSLPSLNHHDKFRSHSHAHNTQPRTRLPPRQAQKSPTKSRAESRGKHGLGSHDSIRSRVGSPLAASPDEVTGGSPEKVNWEGAFPTGEVSLSKGDSDEVKGDADTDVYMIEEELGELKPITSPSGRPISQLQERRLNSANRVKLDGKFTAFTRRPSTLSSLLIPVRSVNAPLLNTEEEKSILRILTLSDTELASIQLTPAQKILLANKIPNTSTIGQYTDAVSCNSHTDRRELFSRVARLTNLEETQKESNRARAAGSKEATRREKDDLINNRRSRFVDPQLVPPVRDKNDLLNLIREAKKEKASDEDNKKIKKTLSIFAKTSDLDNGKDDLSNAEKRKRAKFLRGREVTYGAGRLTSTHNMKGGMEYPFEFVSDGYLPDAAAN